MAQPASAAAVAPRLAFAPTTQAHVRTQAEALWQAYRRQQQPRVNAYSLHGARQVRVGGEGAYEFVGVTEGKKRDGSTIRVDGIDLSGLERVPVFLWAHDYERRPTIGKIVRLWKEDHARLGRMLKFAVVPAILGTGGEEEEFVKRIFKLYELDFLRAVSFGWAPVEMEPLTNEDGTFSGFDFRRSDALEFSAVNVPADPDARIERAIREGLIPEKFVSRFTTKPGRDGYVYTVRDGDEDAAADEADEDADDALADETVGDVPAEEPMDEPADEPEDLSAARASRPYHVEADHAGCPAGKPFAVVKDADGEVMGCHASETKAKKQMAALYAHEPPADVTVTIPHDPARLTEEAVRQKVQQSVDAALADLEPALLRALEHQRIGAVLSRKNRQKLEAAVAAIQDVLASAEKQDDERTTEPAEPAAVPLDVLRRIEDQLARVMADRDDLADLRRSVQKLEQAQRARSTYRDLVSPAARAETLARRLGKLAGATD